LLFVLVSLSQTPTKQKKLRNCSNNDFYWDNCIGTRSVASGAIQYVGEFHSDSFNGKGTLTLANGEGEYVGEFLADKFNGQGTLTNTNGKYVGQFRDNAFNGHGTFTYTNGDVLVGEFRDGKANGQGTQTFFNTGAYEGKYVGEFRDGVLSGHGTFTYANGNTYVGDFSNGNFNGNGVLTSLNGSSVVGQFKDGSYIGPSSGPASTSSSVEVRLERQGGVLLVPVLINGRMLLDFIIDSGASDVTIPADVVSTLWRTGTLADTDFTGSKTYVLADGSTMPSTTFRIRSLRVGDRVLENVSGSIAPSKGPLLLGQSFLSRFKSWSVDNIREVLLLQ
jgi:hypothetical protein